MRTLTDIRQELDRAIESRAELWEDLSQGHDAAKATEASRLSARIDDLWAEARGAKARLRFGSPELIIQRARAEEKLDRESRRLRTAA